MCNLNNPAKARVAKLWTAAILLDLGWQIETLPKASRLYVTKDDRKLVLRTKACYSDQGVPFQGFRIDDSDFVIFVDLRGGALRAEVWVVPTTVVFNQLEQAYREMKADHHPNRTLYWRDGRQPHYGFECKFQKYRNAWELLDRTIVIVATTHAAQPEAPAP